MDDHRRNSHTHVRQITPSAISASSTSACGVLSGRPAGLIAIGVLAIMSSFTMQWLGWRVDETGHTVLEAVSTTVACTVGVLTLVRFFARRFILHLYVGAAFFGTAILDGLHTALTSSSLAGKAVSIQSALIPWSWTASRLFLAAMLLLSLYVQQCEKTLPLRRMAQARSVLLGTLLFTVVCFLLFACVPLPEVPKFFHVHRVNELPTALLFAASFGLVIRGNAWRSDPFIYWLAASLLVAAISECFVMAFSANLFDVRFTLAHLLKLASYVCVGAGVILDIYSLYRSTEQMSLQLAAGEAKLRGVIDQMFNFVGLLTIDGVLIDGNRTALDAAGVSADDVFGLPFWETPWWKHSPELQERLKLSVQRAARGEVDRFEASHPTPDGSLIYVDFSLKPLLDDSGTVLYLVPEGRDITQHKLSAEALRTAELRLENALDGAHIGVWDWNVQTNDVFVSPQLTSQLGSDLPWTSLDDWTDRIHPDDHVAALKVIDDYLHGRVPEYHNIFRLRHDDGGYRWILSRGQLLRDQHQAPLRMVGVHIDITERVEQQTTLSRQAQELRASNEELEQFAYIASHDLQEPLRAISGYVQLLARRYQDNLDSTAQDYIRRTVDGTRRMQTLISDLLDYSRVSRADREFHDVSLTECMHEVRRQMDSSLRDAHAVIETGDLPMVHGDAGLLIRLLQNLVGNSVKYRSDLAPHIRVTADPVPHNGMWTIKVSDNGIGIPEEFADRVFVIFQRLHSQKAYPGTGIGLAVCRRIVERHGGRIRVESNGRAGSTFIFTLPAPATPPHGVVVPHDAAML